MKKTAFLACALMFLLACKQSGTVRFAIPAAFIGRVHVDIVVPTWANTGIVVIPIDKTGHGKATMLPAKIGPDFSGVQPGQISGYHEDIQRTGDGIPVSGFIEFMVNPAK